MELLPNCLRFEFRRISTMNRKILIILADWIGHIGFLFSAGLAGWCLIGMWISGPEALGLLPIMVVALAISVLMYIMYTWVEEHRNMTSTNIRQRYNTHNEVFYG